MIIDFDSKTQTFSVRAPYALKEALKSVPTARWDKQQKVWRYRATPSVASALADIDGNATVAPEFNELLNAGPRADMIRDYNIDELIVPASRIASWPHQIRAYNLIRQQYSTLLAYEMGTGKSKVIVDYVCNCRPKYTLIVCPKSVMPVWMGQFIEHARGNYKIVCPFKGSTRQKLSTCKSHMESLPRAPCIYVLNYDAVWRGELGKWIAAQSWNLIVLDESHRIKAHNSNCSKYLATIGQYNTRRVCLTGTPMPHSPLDLYGQFRFLDAGIFGIGWIQFQMRYALMGGFAPAAAGRPVQVLKYINQDELQEKMYSITDRVTAQDVLSLPDVLHTQRFIDLTDNTRRIYVSLEEDMMADIDAGVITASNALARLLRLQQITSGFAKTEDGVERDISSEKSDELKSVFDDLPFLEPIVVFCRFRRDLQRIAEAAENSSRCCYEISGSRHELEAWKHAAASKGAVLAVQIQAGGLGIDLTAARYCVWYSVGFSLGDYEQCLARLHRPGQKHVVTYIHLIASDTVDGKIYKALAQKRDVITAILETYKEQKNATGQRQNGNNV